MIGVSSLGHIGFCSLEGEKAFAWWYPADGDRQLVVCVQDVGYGADEVCGSGGLISQVGI
jgi:hypothetical protein